MNLKILAINFIDICIYKTNCIFLRIKAMIQNEIIKQTIFNILDLFEGGEKYLIFLNFIKT